MKKIFAGITVSLLMALTVITQNAAAVGTPAGTVIETRSKVIYTSASGAVSDTVFSNSVAFTVAQIAAVNITPISNALTTNRDSVFVEYPLTVTNSGNGPDQFTLSKISSKGWTAAFYFDADGDGVLQSGETTSGAVTQTASIAADETYKVIVRIFVPKDPSLNGQTDTTTVTVVSLFDDTKVNTASARTTVQTVNFANAATGWSVTPTNPSPGDNVTYSITLTNTGSVAATGVSLSDLINTAQFTFVSGSASPGEINTTGNPITWAVGTINPGGSVTVSITLQVNPGLTNGTVLNNTLAVTYTVGGNTFTVVTNNPPAAIGVLRGVEFFPLNFSSEKEPEDTLVYPITLKNTGNTRDVLEIDFSSSRNLSWVFFKDVNQNASLDAGDTQLANTNGTAGVDVDSVNAYDSVKVLARLIVPFVPVDQTQDITTFTVTSSVDQTKFQSANGTTTINTANVVLTRAVSPLGNQPPGTEMTFTITYRNNGHGKAYNAVIAEPEHEKMTYTGNSVTINEIAATDAADEDAVSVTTIEGKKVISINLGVLNGQSSVGTITYKAVIK